MFDYVEGSTTRFRKRSTIGHSARQSSSDRPGQVRPLPTKPTAGDLDIGAFGSVKLV